MKAVTARLSTALEVRYATRAAEARRLGMQAFDAEGNATGDLETCTAIHGEAFSGAYLVAGCREGVLTATTSDDGLEYEMLECPPDLPQDVTTGTILGSNAIQMFLGNHGPDGLVVIDPVDEPHFNCHDNAAVETCLKTIKAELIWRHTRETRRQAETAIFRYVDGFHNPRRRHSAGGGKSPLAFERQVA